MHEQVLIITVGSRGIGAATARLAAAEGYAVCISYLRNQPAAEAVVRDIEQAGGKAMAVAADVAVEADVVRLFETVDAELGRVTALVNNAGILERHMRVEEMDAGRLLRVLAANVIGSFLCAREAVRRPARGGVAGHPLAALRRGLVFHRRDTGRGGRTVAGWRLAALVRPRIEEGSS